MAFIRLTELETGRVISIRSKSIVAVKEYDADNAGEKRTFVQYGLSQCVYVAESADAIFDEMQTTERAESAYGCGC